MKITKQQLKQIIKEELEIVMETWDDESPEVQAMRDRMLRNEEPPVAEETYGLTDEQLKTLEMIGKMGAGRAAVRNQARSMLPYEEYPLESPQDDAVEDLVDRFAGAQ